MNNLKYVGVDSLFQYVPHYSHGPLTAAADLLSVLTKTCVKPMHVIVDQIHTSTEGYTKVKTQKVCKKSRTYDR